jgi:hypothetical protein
LTTSFFRVGKGVESALPPAWSGQGKPIEIVMSGSDEVELRSLLEQGGREVGRLEFE